MSSAPRGPLAEASIAGILPIYRLRRCFSDHDRSTTARSRIR
jgi:hypothetical protein